MQLTQAQIDLMLSLDLIRTLFKLELMTGISPEIQDMMFAAAPYRYTTYGDL